MIGLGIDTGGTCTDAVIFDLDSQRVLDTAKTLTTKESLRRGIENAICALEREKLSRVSFVSLSTTLATNACVENRGARVKLLFIGVRENIVRENYREYGFESMDDLVFMDGVPEGGCVSAVAPDWERLESMADVFEDARAIGIVQYFPQWNAGAFEKKARDILRKKYDVPIVCGSELFSDLNAIKRGAGTYLNIRLIPIISDFLESIRHVLKKYSLNVPVYIVRSDGTLMNEEFAKNHPVETLLCGPAASAMGGAWMSSGRDAVIVDIGGTTTDIALLKKGVPVTVDDGIKINGWKTFVKGLFIDTFGLGGDSAVRLDKGRVYLESFRVLPQAMAAAEHTEIKDKLKKIQMPQKSTPEPAHEGFVLLKELPDDGRYTERQRQLCECLKKEALLCSEAISLTGITYYRHTIERLEKENIILRFGLTPTDIMHINGDYTRYDTQSALLAAEVFAQAAGMSVGGLCREVYELFRKKLYKNIVRVLLEQEKEIYPKGLPKDILRFIDIISDGGFSQIKTSFSCPAVFVGVGGPAHIFMPQLEESLANRVFIHENSMVANAIGTLAGRICVSESLDISFGSGDNGEGYSVFINGRKTLFEKFDDAVFGAREYLEEIVCEKARQRGAEGEIHLENTVEELRSSKGSKSLLLGGRVCVTAHGSI